jgi:2-polyprenyl-3-methyl-5-hydroxy-6-metoxy-1,4-benzoquinol methylase
MSKLIVAYIGDKCADWGKLSIDSVVKEADKIVFVCGLEDPAMLEMLKEQCKVYPNKIEIIERTYEHNHKGANGRARNAYLDYLKRWFIGDWCLVLDPDEIVDNIQQLKNDIDRGNFAGDIYNVKMRHTIRDLMHEDTTQKEHWCPRRLFKIAADMSYPETEHPVLYQPAIQDIGYYSGICIWHFAYSKSMMEIKKKYETHKLKSEMHSVEFLRWWYSAHVTGLYPNEAICLDELPAVVKTYFELEDMADQVYFQRRMGLETKHFIDAVMWKEYFKAESALDIGCGVGLRLFCMNEIGVETKGLEISKWAVTNTPFKKYRSQMAIGKVENLLNYYPFESAFDLVYAYDVLEHLEEKDLIIVLKQIALVGMNFVFSMPFENDPNYKLDPSHKICHSREWWIQQIESAGIKVKPTPEHFLFKEQIIIGVKE